jgi:hypothetical protein
VGREYAKRLRVKLHGAAAGNLGRRNPGEEEEKQFGRDMWGLGVPGAMPSGANVRAERRVLCRWTIGPTFTGPTVNHVRNLDHGN